MAYLARFMVEQELKSGKLFEIPVDDPHEFYFWKSSKKGRQMSLAARKFLEQLKGAKR